MFSCYFVVIPPRGIGNSPSRPGTIRGKRRNSMELSDFFMHTALGPPMSTPSAIMSSKNHEPPPTKSRRAPPPTWSARTCPRFELGDMSPSPQAVSCHRTPNHRRQTNARHSTARLCLHHWMLDVSPILIPSSTLNPRLSYETHRQNRPSPAPTPRPTQPTPPQR